MDCELCSTSGQGGGATRCQRCGFDTTLPPDVKHFLISLVGFRPGELLEKRYRIDRILGYGGMSVVYKAHDEALGEDVAIKVINRGRLGDENKLFTDIRRDIVTTRKLAHPDIVKIYDLHTTDTCGFLTMEFVPGSDVASLIAARGRLGEVDVCRIAAQVAEALHYAHINGVIHCDIKPANLLLAGNERVKIADFGISRLMQEESSGLTGLVVGTPAYMAPEQIRGERPDPRTDMYALGIVMWHCLMGKPPYTRGDIAYQHVHEPLPPLIGVSPAVERIVRRAAGKARDDRYQSMAVLARELHEILDTLTPAVAATLVQSPPPGSAATIVQSPPPRPADAARRTPPLEGAGTVAQGPLPAPVGGVTRTPSPELAGTVAQTRPPAPVGTVVQTPSPVAAATVAQTPSLQAAGTVVQAPPSVSATTVAQAPPRTAGAGGRIPPLETAPASEQAPPRRPDGQAPAGTGGRVPPAPGGPGGETGSPPPVLPPSSSKNRVVAVAAVVVMLAAVAVWGLFFRSPESNKSGQPLLATGVGLPPPQAPPGGVAAVPPAEPPVPGPAPSVPQRTAVGGAGAAVRAAGAVAVVVGGSRAEGAPGASHMATGQTAAGLPASVPVPVPAAGSPSPAAATAAPSRGTEIPVVPPSQPGTPESRSAAVPVVPPPTSPAVAASPVPASAPIPVTAPAAPPAPVQQTAAVQPPAPVRQAVPVSMPVPAQPPMDVRPPVSAQPALPVQQAASGQLPANAPATRVVAPEPVPAKLPPPPVARDLGPSIQTAALPRGRWCDLRVRAVGNGLPMAAARSDGERRLTAERSADIDAYRRLAEYVKGVQVSGGSTVKDFLTSDASYKTKIDAVIRGARRIDSQKNDDGTWSVVMELTLAGMCDVIQAGTP